VSRVPAVTFGPLPPRSRLPPRLRPCPVARAARAPRCPVLRAAVGRGPRHVPV